jgi:hypothetical protein
MPQIDGRLTFNVKKDDRDVPVSCAEVVEVSNGDERCFVLMEWDLVENTARICEVACSDQLLAVAAYAERYGDLAWGKWMRVPS